MTKHTYPTREDGTIFWAGTWWAGDQAKAVIERNERRDNVTKEAIQRAKTLPLDEKLKLVEQAYKEFELHKLYSENTRSARREAMYRLLSWPMADGVRVSDFINDNPCEFIDHLEKIIIKHQQ